LDSFHYFKTTLYISFKPKRIRNKQAALRSTLNILPEKYKHTSPKGAAYFGLNEMAGHL